MYAHHRHQMIPIDKSSSNARQGSHAHFLYSLPQYCYLAGALNAQLPLPNRYIPQKQTQHAHKIHTRKRFPFLPMCKHLPPPPLDFRRLGQPPPQVHCDPTLQRNRTNIKGQGLCRTLPNSSRCRRVGRNLALSNCTRRGLWCGRGRSSRRCRCK